MKILYLHNWFTSVPAHGMLCSGIAVLHSYFTTVQLTVNKRNKEFQLSTSLLCGPKLNVVVNLGRDYKKKLTQALWSRGWWWYWNSVVIKLRQRIIR